MAAKKFVKGTEMYEMFRDYYNMMQSLWIPEDTDEYRQQAKSMMNDFITKYNNAIHAVDLCYVFRDELCRRGAKGLENEWQ